jgi:hypothetical protein
VEFSQKGNLKVSAGCSTMFCTVAPYLSKDHSPFFGAFVNLVILGLQVMVAHKKTALPTQSRGQLDHPTR